MKAHRQCPLVLLVKIVFRAGKRQRIEEGKAVGSGLFYVMSRGKKLMKIFTELGRNFDINIERVASGRNFRMGG